VDELKTNLIIATYFGPRGGPMSSFQFLLEHGKINKQEFDRRVKLIRQKKTGHSYLLSNLSKLETVKHSLSQITIVVNECENELPEVTSYLNNLKSIGNTPIVILRRENKGMSYGSYNYAFATYKDKFNYYIFTEDDYVFVKDNFDRLLVDLFLEKRCGYLCAGVSTDEEPFKSQFKGFGKIGCISHGISDFKSLNAVYNHFGGLPLPQTVFTRSFLHVGLTIEDWRGRYKSPYYNSIINKVKEFFEDGEYLIVPVQMDWQKL